MRLALGIIPLLIVAGTDRRIRLADGFAGALEISAGGGAVRTAAAFRDEEDSARDVAPASAPAPKRLRST